MPTILSGRTVRDSLTPKLIERVKGLSFTPTLAIIQAGDRPDSASYIRAKKSFAEKIGVKVRHLQLPENILQEPLIKIIRQCNDDETVHGIVVQLPLPSDIDRESVINSVDSRKDVDALTSYNVKRWKNSTELNSTRLNSSEQISFPATARGVREILAYHRIDLFKKQVCVVGRSELVGKPIAAMCAAAGAAVTVCHSRTLDLPAETKKADILIVAAGKPGLITAKYVKKGAVVIDVGINKITGEKLEDEIPGAKIVGDVDFAAVSAAIGDGGAITPVPGGVGPMTVLALFENLIDLCDKI